jgi:predicted porin
MFTMKKSLIALSVFGMFTGAAMADGNSVTLYGKIDAGVTHFTGISNGAGGTTSSTGLSSGITGGNRIGVKGTEDLGGGLKVLFDAETGFCGTGLSQDQVVGSATNGAAFCTGGGFMQRQAYVGLTGDFGTVLAGRQYTAIYGAEATLDPFGSGYTGQAFNVSPLDQTYHLYRADQDLAYVTPNLSGFTGTAAYVFSAGGTVANAATPGTSNVPRAFDLKGEYANGPIYAVLDYAEVTNKIANTTTGVNDGKVKLWLAGGTYDFGVAKLAAMYEQTKQDYSTGNQKMWMLGATVPVGAGSIMASYVNSKNTTNGLDNATAKQYAVGYTYSLSKQTSVYTSYAHISNDANTKFTVGTATDGFAGAAGQGSSGFALGMVHNF